MICLLDVNALPALGFHEHEFHGRVARWVAALGGEITLATCPITELGFVRILSQVPQYRITIEQARTLLARLKSSRARRLTFIADSHGAERLPRWVKTGRQTTDGHLCALAAANAATLTTLDGGSAAAFVIPESWFHGNLCAPKDKGLIIGFMGGHLVRSCLASVFPLCFALRDLKTPSE
ncbi:MAG: hypothetical protein WCK55_00870 [Verrucomicrobiota bacterium]